MNNNELKFDPNTGQPINNNVNNNEPKFDPVTGQPINIQEQPVVEQQIANVEAPNTGINIQQQMQTIPNVDQNQQVFLNNSQANNEEKKENNSDSSNITFLVIIFIIIFAAILFLFPILTKYI